MIGVYLIVFLSLVRFLVYPLHTSVDEKKRVLAELYESYDAKARLFERQRKEGEQQGPAGKAQLKDATYWLARAYDKTVRLPLIQADTVESLLKTAEKRGMTVLDFEFLEPAVGQNISEVPVTIRLSGQPGSFLDVLRDVEKNEQTLTVKSLEINRVGTEFRFFVTLSAYRTER